MKKIKIINVVGARPNFMKIAPLMAEMKKYDQIHPVLLHTGQHYDEKMSKLFFEELHIPKPDIFLGVGSNTHAKQVAKIMDLFDDVCAAEKPDAVLVVGDVNSTLACSLVASKLGIKIIHLEAGLRSFDRTMPEEINRIVTDSLSDLLLTPSEDANEQLLKEGIDRKKIHWVGNIMIDTLYHVMPTIETSKILETFRLTPNRYVLVTLHRPSNVDTKENLTTILNLFQGIPKDFSIVFPIHPRTKKNLTDFGLDNVVNGMTNLILTEPLGYIDFQRLMTKTQLVITDSGGIQEETTTLKIPCITLRDNTERPITVTMGSNILVKKNEFGNLPMLLEKALSGNWKKSEIPPFWDGMTSQRVVDVILKHL